ncbi:MAG: hypothetical protein RL189_1035 [Pseudomonadota bacterium]
MKHCVILTLTGTLSVLAAGCKTRSFGGEIKGTLDKTEDLGPLSFNALEMLKDQKLTPVTEYPKNYKGNWNIVLGPNGDGIREVPSDGVFFSSRKDWFTTMQYDQQTMGGGANRGDGVFEPVDEGGLGGLKKVDMPTAEPTSYAKVTADDPSKKSSGGVLTYEFEGRVLSIGFTEIQENEVKKTHAEAIEHCAAKNLRLPTARELFDFCTAGLEAKLLPSKVKSWAFVHRCVNVYHPWSMTLRANNLKQAWVNAGWPRSTDRTEKNPFYCVGAVKTVKVDQPLPQGK